MMNITKDFIKHCSRLYNNNHKFNDNTIIKIGIGKECSNVSVTPYNKQDKISQLHSKISNNINYNQFKTLKNIKEITHRFQNKIIGTFEIDDIFITLTQMDQKIKINDDVTIINDFTEKVTDVIQAGFNRILKKYEINVTALLNVNDVHKNKILHFHALVKFSNNIFNNPILATGHLIKEDILDNLKNYFKKYNLNCKIKRIYNVNGLANYLGRKQSNIDKYIDYADSFKHIPTNMKLYRTKGKVEKKKEYYIEYGVLKNILNFLFEKTNINETFSKQYFIKDTDGNILYRVSRFTLEFDRQYYDLINNTLKQYDIRHLDNVA